MSAAIDADRRAGIFPSAPVAAGPIAAYTRRRPARLLPGFGLSAGVVVTYLSLIVLIPLASVFLKAGGLGWRGLAHLLADPRVQASLRLTFGTALAAAGVNAVLGLWLAWVFTRYRFAGRRFLDAAIDLPFALPTAVAGIALAGLYAGNGWVGALLARAGIKVAYTPLGIGVAMVFIGLPFVVRTVQPVLAEAERGLEEAAATLGASRWTTVTRVILPTVIPAWLTGFALAFARAVGEYGSVIFIAGNLPYVSEVSPLLIVIKLEEFDYPSATAIAAAMLVLSFAVLLLINLLQARVRRGRSR